MPRTTTHEKPPTSPTRLDIPIRSGVVLIGSDAHYWPGDPSTGHRAFIWAIRELQPTIVIMNGDVLDAARISRHPPLGWEWTPTVQEELDVSTKRMEEIRLACPRAQHIWTYGNHDTRFDVKLATNAAEFRGVAGTSLLDHFPEWKLCWSVSLGGQRGAVVMHRAKGGLHATHHNALWSGRSLVTGHLHQQRITPVTDLNGTRWGVDCGMLADPGGRQFAYLEETPANWRSGFAILTWETGRLLPPELVHVIGEGEMAFRGKVIDV